MTERTRLTDALALAARPRAREYAIRDVALPGFALRVQPGGARTWVLRFRRDGRPRRITLGSPDAVTAAAARRAALAMLARESGTGAGVPTPVSGLTLARFAAEYLERRTPSWTLSGRASVQTYLQSAILPALGRCRVDAVTRVELTRWLHAYGRRRPGGANRCHDILRAMFACAIDWGYRPAEAGNPCWGITRFRRPPRGRLIGAEDLAKLGAALRACEDRWPVRVAAVRLILLTGCRPGEIRRLRWSEVKPDRLALGASKTGPRDVLLGAAARMLLKYRASTATGAWVFAERGLDAPINANALRYLWNQVRDRAELTADARLHDLRHSHASHAIMAGESLHVTGRLLGHRRPGTTYRYAHLDDATLSLAAEQVALTIEEKLARSNAVARQQS